MPLGQGILDVLEAIPRRIEMSGHEPTWRLTGPSFDAVWEFALEVLPGDPVVVAREDRNRLWPRVTLTLTIDPKLAAGAPPIDELRAPRVPQQRQPPPKQLWNDEEYAESFSPLEEIFAHQEEVRAARRQLPDQRDGGSHKADAS
jgi:hypothetical protein